MVAAHDRPAPFYELLAAVEVEVLDQERCKPPCRDEFRKPPADAALAHVLADAVSALAPRRRSRR